MNLLLFILPTLNEADWMFIRLVVICVCGIGATVLMERHDSAWFFRREAAGASRWRLVFATLLALACAVAGMWTWVMLWRAR